MSGRLRVTKDWRQSEIDGGALEPSRRGVYAKACVGDIGLDRSADMGGHHAGVG